MSSTQPIAPRGGPQAEGAQYPFDLATQAAIAAEEAAKAEAEREANKELPTLPDKLRLHLRTLSFASTNGVVLLALLVMMLLHAAGLGVFSRGFLLTRRALEQVNDCSPTANSGNLDPSCSVEATHNKMVFLVVDALRADFVLPVNANRSASARFTPSPHYHNQLTLPARLTNQQPTHSFLSHFIADAPTTTLQRLKGLTTGSLPTFVDAGSNFGGERITEDNWLSQAKRAGKKLALVGDNTWLNVFPLPTTGPDGVEGVWDADKVWPFDSFNVEDLDTVDNGVAEHLLALLEGDRGDWDIAIAHTLGLDHAGHRFGPSHPETARKLAETEQLLIDVVTRLDDDTLLVVLGDHGMTNEGDHGGDSREEVDAALWIYSKTKPLTHKSWFNHPLSSRSHPLASLFAASASAGSVADRLQLDWPDQGLAAPARSVSQVDLVPTISLLLGLPIPFGNLGLPIPELFWRSSALPVAPTPADNEHPKPKRSFFGAFKNADQPQQREEEATSPLQTLLQASLLTSSQLSHYLATYLESPSGADLAPAMPELSFILGVAKSAYMGAHAPGHVQHEMELRALEKFWHHGRLARQKARDIWAKFDPPLMLAGLVIWAGSVAVGLRFFAATGAGPSARILVGRAFEGAILAGWATFALWLLDGLRVVGGLTGPRVVVVVAGGAELAVLLAPWNLGTGSFAETYSLPPNFSWRHLAPALPVIGHSLLFTSNSFTVHEDSAVLFFLSTILLLAFLRSLSAPEVRLRNRLVGFLGLALVSVRVMAYLTVCREEQGPYCVPTFHLGAGSWSALVALALAGVAGWYVPTGLRAVLAISAADEGVVPVFLSGGVRALLVSGVGYWAIDWLIAALEWDPTGTRLLTLVKTGLARGVLVGGFLTATLLWHFTPLCLRVEREVVKNPDGSDRTLARLIGFANTLGSSYLLYFAPAFAMIVLLSPPQAQLVHVLHLVVLVCLLEAWDSERDAGFLSGTLTSASLEALLNDELAPALPHQGPSFTQLSTLALLAQVAFFGTGHQAALSSIQWSTAFIGFPHVVYPFSPALVVHNSFGPFVTAALAVPLFVFWNLSPTLKDQPPMKVARHLLKAAVGFSTYWAVVGLGSAVFAGWFRRHLMVWKVFGPRFMAAGLVVLVVDVVLLVEAVGWGGLGTIGKVKKGLGTRVVE